MQFTLKYFTSVSGRSPIKQFIDAQDPQARDKIYEVIEYFLEYGFHLSTNYLRRMSGSKRLWELRAKQRSRQYRVFLAKVNDETIILLHAIIKKTPKTPKQDIQTAEERLKLFEEGAT